MLNKEIKLDMYLNNYFANIKYNIYVRMFQKCYAFALRVCYIFYLDIGVGLCNFSLTEHYLQFYQQILTNMTVEL